ncbi:MAG: polyphenol oxidase family protein [Treponemataceae bacterium]|nr:polyphenol oxidase family protein [Treponemataceae bacterium]
MELYPFTLSLDSDFCFRFPFIYRGTVLADVDCVLSSRRWGDMRYTPAAENEPRRVFFSHLGLDFSRVVGCVQTHSKVVWPVDLSTWNRYNEGDGLLTEQSDVWLSVTVADCLPVYLTDLEGRWRLLLHSGWKGTGIARTALEGLAQMGNVPPSRIVAVLGPCIRSCCYEVDKGRALQFYKDFGFFPGPYPLGPVVVQDGQGGPYRLDLQAANAALLAAMGVEHIAYCTDCTMMNEHLGSYRREGPNSYTRMVALLGSFSESKGPCRAPQKDIPCTK